MRLPMDGSALWAHGWCLQAQRLASPNFGPRKPHAQVDLLVVHSISLPPGQYGNGDIARLFTNTLDWAADPYYETIRGLEVSAHFVIGRTGALWQFVSCDDRAWHAGVSSYRGRGNCNDDSIGVELEGVEGLAFEDPQYATLVWLAKALAARYPIAHIAGHEHIAPGRKQDPGLGFDWALLRQRLDWPLRYFPEV